MENKDVRLDLYDIFNIDRNEAGAKLKLKAKIDEVFPKIRVDDIVGFGKYKSKTWREIFTEDPGYILWALRTLDKDFDRESFVSLLKP